MVRMRAPHGGTHFSHEGVVHKIDEDGTVEVPHHVAATLTSHGFVDANAKPAPSEDVTIKRSDILSVLQAMGVALSDEAMAAEQLVEAFLRAVVEKLGLGSEPPAKNDDKADKAAEKPAKDKPAKDTKGKPEGEHGKKHD